MAYLHVVTTVHHVTGLADDLLQTNPNLVCVILTPIPTTLGLVLFMMYLAFFRLLMVTKTNVFINLNHEAVVTKLNIATVVILLADILAGLVYKGTTCNVKIAKVFLQLIGVTENTEDFSKDVIEDPITFLLMNLVISLAVILYFLSYLVLIKYKPCKPDEIVNYTPFNTPLNSVHPSTPYHLPLNTMQSLGPIPQLIHVSPFQPSTSNIPLVEVVEVVEASKQTSTELLEAIGINLTTATTSLPPQIVDAEELYVIPTIRSQTTRFIADVEPHLPTKQLLPNERDTVTVPVPPNTRTTSTEPGDEVTQRTSPAAPQTNPVSESPLSNSDDKSHLMKLIQKIPFSVGIVSFFIIFTAPFVDGNNTILAVIVDKGVKYVLACAPMYWVLMVEDVYTFSLRKTRVLLADNFQMYFD